MDRRVSILAACVASLVALGGCQDYNFNPVGHCLIQPGTERVTLSKITTADVLFVVDDSGSMKGEQDALAANFAVFLDDLATTNKDRLAAGLTAIDFHVAVTTTALYNNEGATLPGSICSDQCPGAEGSWVCCLKNSTGLDGPQPPLCVDGGAGDCTGANVCQSSGDGLDRVALYTPTGCFTGSTPQRIPCTRHGEACGVLDHFYHQRGSCSLGYAQALTPYPAGDFMADPANTSLVSAEAKGEVLEFAKDAGWATWSWTPGGGIGAGTSQTLKDLATAFSNNVQVGTCGSPQEQGLEAARRAINAARAAKRTDWLHPESKLVVVWVTDEDDCSAPFSHDRGVTYPQGGDVDAACAADVGGKEFTIDEYVNYFTTLGRPFGAAFIISANTGCGVDQTCRPDKCVTPGCTSPPEPINSCGGQAEPTRYFALAQGLAADRRMNPDDVVMGSICDPFGATLARIAQVVKPPSVLELPTLPAAGKVAILRIVRADGSTRYTCNGPAPAGLTVAEARADGWEWWFVKTNDPLLDADKVSQPPTLNAYVFKDPGNVDVTACQANQGETFSVDYLGRLPESGCTSAFDCSSALGGTEAQWQCWGYDAGTSPVTMGTCLCAGT